jgi:hypothetical protein
MMNVKRVKTIKLRIPRMDHRSSQEIVRHALKRVGIHSIFTIPGEVEITYNDPWKKARIIEAIEETGFIVVNY